MVLWRAVEDGGNLYDELSAPWSNGKSCSNANNLDRGTIVHSLEDQRGNLLQAKRRHLVKAQG